MSTNPYLYALVQEALVKSGRWRLLDRPGQQWLDLVVDDGVPITTGEACDREFKYELLEALPG